MLEAYLHMAVVVRYIADHYIIWFLPNAVRETKICKGPGWLGPARYGAILSVLTRP